MTTMHNPVEEATAAASGASATERFHADKSPFEAVKDTAPERVDELAREVLAAVHDTIRRHQVTYDEYNALKAWMIQVGQDGEWPLFLDVWVEHVVEDVDSHTVKATRAASRVPTTCRVHPSWVRRHHPDARRRSPARRWCGDGRITTTDGKPIGGGQGRTVARGCRRVLLAVRPRHSRVEPARIVLDRPRWQVRHHHDPTRALPDPDGWLLREADPAAGWHAWRPAHLHVKVSAPGITALPRSCTSPATRTTRMTLPCGQTGTDARPDADAQGRRTTVTYGFVLDAVQA